VAGGIDDVVVVVAIVVEVDVVDDVVDVGAIVVDGGVVVVTGDKMKPTSYVCTFTPGSTSATGSSGYAFVTVASLSTDVSKLVAGESAVVCVSS
jgi:hypothetical protein